MNKKVLLPLLALCFWLGSPRSGVGQSFDFASANIGMPYTDMHSLIRTIDDTSALVYYYDYSADSGVIARVGLNLSCRKALLPKGCRVNDMRITGNNVYFCGHLQADPIIGHIKLSDFGTTTRTVTLYKVDNNYVTNLNRMVAYTTDRDTQKVVIVGDVIFTEHPDSSNFPCPYDTTYYDSVLCDSVHFFYYNCISSIVLEVNFRGNTRYSDRYVATTKIPSHLELISEVVETQDNVVFIGYYTNHHTTIIHRCDKDNVLNSLFNVHWCYWGIDEGHSNYHGCVMKGDTIAVSSLSTFNDASGLQQFSTNIRVFNIFNMDNISAQRVPLNTKSEPYDMVYMIEDKQLVLLQDIYLPTLSSVQNSFLYVNPYSKYTVYSKCWYESYKNWTFNCLSRLTDTVYVASGGEYWCLKDIYPLTPDSCYKTDAIEITPIETVKYAKETDTYYHRSNFVGFLYRRSSYENELLTPSCIINN